MGKQMGRKDKEDNKGTSINASTSIWVRLNFETRRSLNDKYNRELVFLNYPGEDPDSKYPYMLDNRVLCFRSTNKKNVREDFFATIRNLQETLANRYPSKDFVIEYGEKDNIGSIYFIWDTKKSIKNAETFRDVRNKIIEKVNKVATVKIPEENTFYPLDKLPD